MNKKIINVDKSYIRNYTAKKMSQNYAKLVRFKNVSKYL